MDTNPAECALRGLLCTPARPQEPAKKEDISNEDALSFFHGVYSAADKQRVYAIVVLTILIALSRSPLVAIKEVGVENAKVEHVFDGGVTFFVAWTPLIAFLLVLRSHFSMRKTHEVANVILTGCSSDALLSQLILANMLKTAPSRKSSLPRKGLWLLRAMGRLFAVELPLIAYIFFVIGDFFLRARIGPAFKSRPIDNLWSHGATNFKSSWDAAQAINFPGVAIPFYFLLLLISVYFLVSESVSWLRFWCRAAVVEKPTNN